MVIDNIKNACLYYGLSKRIKIALKFLQNDELLKMEPGKYQIDKNNVYALVQNYESKLSYEGKWEAHRKYVDIQYVLEGTEKIGYYLINNLELLNEYNEKDDYILFKGKGEMLVFNTGTFAIFYPTDAHMPSMAIDDPKFVKKVVVKVKL